MPAPEPGTQPAYYADQYRALQDALDKGILDADEYAEKKRILDGRSNDRKTLEELREANLLSEEEYLDKKRAVESGN